MLVLRCEDGEGLTIGGIVHIRVWIEWNAVTLKNQIKIGIDAPPEINIVRDELLDAGNPRSLIVPVVRSSNRRGMPDSPLSTQVPYRERNLHHASNYFHRSRPASAF